MEDDLFENNNDNSPDKSEFDFAGIPNHSQDDQNDAVPQDLVQQPQFPQPQFETRGHTVAAARRMVQGPAISLFVLSVLWTLVIGLSVICTIALPPSEQSLPKDSRADAPPNMTAKEEIPGMVSFVTSVVAVQCLIMIGAIQMMRLKTYGLAMTAAILSMIPFCSPCGFVGIPVGIWALQVLNSSTVKSGFSKWNSPVWRSRWPTSARDRHDL